MHQSKCSMRWENRMEHPTRHLLICPFLLLKLRYYMQGNHIWQLIFPSFWVIWESGCNHRGANQNFCRANHVICVVFLSSYHQPASLMFSLKFSVCRYAVLHSTLLFSLSSSLIPSPYAASPIVFLSVPHIHIPFHHPLCFTFFVYILSSLLFSCLTHAFSLLPV